MLETVFSYKENSYSFSEKERQILMMFLNYFKYEIPDGNGSYLAMLDLDKVDFTWCPQMALSNEGVFGAWMVMMPSKVFIRPADGSDVLVDICAQIKLTKEQEENAKRIMLAHRDFLQFKNLNINHDLLRFVFHLIEDNGMILSTVFHELYHKWQFNSAKMFYIFNCLLFFFTGYDFSTKTKWSIEGDVRKYVDNEALHSKIAEFYNMFYTYLYALNTLKNEPTNEYALKRIAEFEEKNTEAFRFANKVYEQIQIF